MLLIGRKLKFLGRLPVALFLADIYIVITVLLNAYIERNASNKFLCLFLLLGIVVTIINTKNRQRFISLLVLISLMQVFYSAFNYSATRIYLFLLFAVVFYYIFETFTSGYDEYIIKPIIYIGVFHSSLCCIEMILHYNFFLSLFNVEGFNGDSTSVYRVTGITAHPITGSVFSISVAILALWFYGKTKCKRYVLFSILSFVATILTQTRSIYIALASTLLALMILKKHKSGFRIHIHVFPVLVFVLLIIFLFFSFVTPESSLYSITIGRFSTLLGSGSFLQRSGSISFLLHYLSGGVTLPLFLGNGFGSLIHYLNVNNIFFVSKDFFTIDNQYITTIYEIGIIGCAVLLFTIFLRLISGIKVLRSNSISTLRMVGTPTAMCIVLLLLAFFFECYDKPIVLCMQMLAFAFADSSK